ncbi:MAG: hypothetical protein H6502_01010 [Candidatus Woesearchaeota archaeon]|nr:MAG: hypothetical protein H6502_01010 [Candidatus Woesearchaeota archaeon]
MISHNSSFFGFVGLVGLVALVGVFLAFFSQQDGNLAGNALRVDVAAQTRLPGGEEIAPTRLYDLAIETVNFDHRIDPANPVPQARIKFANVGSSVIAAGSRYELISGCPQSDELTTSNLVFSQTLRQGDEVTVLQELGVCNFTNETNSSYYIEASLLNKQDIDSQNNFVNEWLYARENELFMQIQRVRITNFVTGEVHQVTPPFSEPALLLPPGALVNITFNYEVSTPLTYLDTSWQSSFGQVDGLRETNIGVNHYYRTLSLPVPTYTYTQWADQSYPWGDQNEGTYLLSLSGVDALGLEHNAEIADLTYELLPPPTQMINVTLVEHQPAFFLDHEVVLNATNNNSAVLRVTDAYGRSQSDVLTIGQTEQFFGYEITLLSVFPQSDSAVVYLMDYVY